MDDIHTPSVASGPTTNGYSNGIATHQLSFNELMAEKSRMEGELTSLGAVLESVRASSILSWPTSAS
jgi:26S proteasome non-ATPase regulatory subunit 9